MDRALVVRVTVLYAPAMLAALPFMWTKPSKRQLTAALLACAWNLPALLLANVIAVKMGWWNFAAAPASLMHVPAELLLGWVVLWGAVPALLLPRLSLPAIVGVFVVADVVLMPLAAPVVVLHDAWLIGEALAVVLGLVPSLLLARWTVLDRHVEWRAAMQAAALSAMLTWLLPQLIFENLHGGWRALLSNWRWMGGLHLQLAAIPALLGVIAVREFAERGQGTPIPFDPPKRLVTSGPYAYVANPMQLAMTLVLLMWGAILGNAWVAGAGGVALLYGVGFAAADEQSDLVRRFGDPWKVYRRHVREWLPRWRPYHPSLDARLRAEPARLYVSESCGQCSAVARWFMARSPQGLLVVAAEQHPSRDLLRVTYDAGDGSFEAVGVAAIARALEHVHLGWALVAWFTRVPGLTPVLQLITDASGGEARLVRRTNPVTECRT